VSVVGLGYVRVTVHPGEDVLLPSGRPLGELRGQLAELLRRPEVGHGRLFVDEVELADESVVGERPLIEGATVWASPRVRTGGPGGDGGRGNRRGRRGGEGGRGGDDAGGGDGGRGRRGGDHGALRGPWVVVRASGAESGELFAVTGEGSIALGGGLEVRAREHRRRGGVEVRAAGARRAAVARGRTVRLVGSRRGRRVGWAWRRWVPSDVLVAGERFEVHPAGDAGTVLAGVGGAPQGRPVGGDASPGAGTGLGLTVATALLPVLGSVGLAVALRQPTFALFSLLGLLAAIPQIVAAVRRRRDDAGPPRSGATRSDAARPAGSRPAAGGLDGDGGAAAVDPGRVARATLAAVQATEREWRSAVTGDDAPARSALDAPFRPLLVPVADSVLAVRGPLGLARAAARAVTAELAARGFGVTVVGGGRAAWAWCRWLKAGSGDAGADGSADGRTGDGASGRTGGRTDGRADVVLVADSPGAADLEAAREARRTGAVVVLCLPPGAGVPAWCREVLDVAASDVDKGRGGTGAVAVRRTPGGAAVAEPFVGVSAAWAERVGRRLAGARSVGRPVGALWAAPSDSGPRSASLPASADPADPRLPGVVPLAALLTVADDARWAVPLGTDAAGRVVSFDLVADGPHLLVAGTTGAGKSELLQSFVLALALRRTPGELALALVDFKGGASFGECAALPHVVGQVTDLDPALAARALDGLRAELRRRKEVLAAHGVADLDALPAGVLPRLVVVVDEFRALADDLPDLLPGLLRVAAQGRSLGVHLVLATQRPAGAVSADVRANVSARIALRVVDAADSHDVLDSPAAALVPAGVPGRAVLRVGVAPPVALQCAYAGARPDAAAAVRRAPVWGGAPVARGVCSGRAQARVPGTLTGAPAAGERDCAYMPGAPTGAGQPGEGAGVHAPGTLRGAHRPGQRARAPESRTRPGTVGALVADAWAACGDDFPRWPAPWLPPLPTIVELDALDGGLQRAPIGVAHGALDGVPQGWLAGVPEGALPVGLGDLPSSQAQVPVSWDPSAGHLAVLGRARSGRTTTLRTLAVAALARGWHVHALVPASTAAALAPLTTHPGFGTLAGPDDARRARRLLRLLQAQGSPGAPVLVLVDGVEEVRDALASPSQDPLAAALTAGIACFAVTAESSGVGGLSARFGPRLVLLSADAGADLMLGAPSALAGRARVPGRAAWLASGEPLECQVALAGPAAPLSTRTLQQVSASVGASNPSGVSQPVRVRSLPRNVSAGDLRGTVRPAGSRATSRAAGALRRPTSWPAPLIGLGGDDVEPVGLDVRAGALAVGPRGSGRTSALRTILQALAPDSVGRVIVVARNRELAADAAASGAEVLPPTAAGLQRLLEHSLAGGGDLPDGTGTGRYVTDHVAPGDDATDHPAPGNDPTKRAATGGDPTDHPVRGRVPTVRAAAPPTVVVVDDADALSQSCPLETERLAELAADGTVAVVASATTMNAVLAHRGLLAHLRATGSGIVLAPSERGAEEVFGCSLEDAVEPGVQLPGRGALVIGGRVTAVQLAAPRPVGQEPSLQAGAA